MSDFGRIALQPKPVINRVLVDRSHWTYKPENKKRTRVQTFRVSGILNALSPEDLATLIEQKQSRVL